MSRPSSHLDLPAYDTRPDTLLTINLDDLAAFPHLAHLVTALLIEVEQTDGVYREGKDIRGVKKTDELDRKLEAAQKAWDSKLLRYQEIMVNKVDESLDSWSFRDYQEFAKKEELDPLPESMLKPKPPAPEAS